MEDTIIKALLLGYAHIECNGTPIRICLKKAQGLLFYLLVHKKATRDELTGLLWGGEDNELARRHLRDNLYHLKKVVPIELVVPAGRSAIQLNPELGFYIDVDEFLKAVDVEGYQGEFLKGFSVPNCYEYEEWLERTRTSLREAYLQQLDKRAEFCLSEGKDGEAEALWRKYLQEEPLCETVSISLMRFYRAQKDYNRAALIYRGLHKAMADTLGIAPLKDTSELYYSIMKEWNEQSENGEINDDFLVGRQNQLQYLLHLFSRMHTSKHARSFVILGEAGVGKTHLLSYFLSHGDVSSYEIITTSCFKSKQDEYLYPWQTIMLSLSNFIEKESIPIPNAYMQAVSALFPMLGEFGSADVRKKAHLLVDSVMGFDSVLTVLTLASKKKPLLLVVEDIQWIDSMILALLDQALHKIGPEKFVFAATCRQPCGKEVERFLRNVEEDELCSLLSLAAFTYEETMQFIELCGARGIVLQDKDRIYHDTQGNAFLLTQLIGSIMENGQPKVLPHSMDEILSYRLSGLSFEGRQVLNLVAMFPDYAPYRVLEVVSSKPTLDLLYVCQELCRRAILNEVYDGGSLSLVFTQAEFRDLTYSHIPALSRRILHLNIAQALSALDSAAMPNLDTLTAYHYEQGGDAFHAFQYKVRRFRTYVFFNYALLNGMPSSSESLLDSTPEALESFQKMKKELCHLQRLHPEDSALKAAETDLYYSIGCFCIYRGLYEQGVSAIRKLLQNPALSEEARDLAHEQMIFYGIQTYQTNVMRENIDAALSLTKGKNAARYAINRRYNGYLLVMEGRYEDAREELLRTLVLLHDSAEDEVERRLQSAYAHDYIGEAYRKQGMYARAIEEYQIAIDMIGEYPTSTSTPIFYVDWAMASLAIGDYAAAHNALSNSNRAADNVKEPTGYFRTLYCACNALMCFADGDYRHCASEILQCEQLTKALIVPYDTGILYLTKALLCCYSAQLDIAETPLADVLTEDIAYYCAHCRKCMAGGKAGAFEQELLKRLECGCSDPLPGFLQVTKN